MIKNLLITPQIHPIELPPQCLFYADPDLDVGCSTLTDWAGIYGISRPRELVNLFGINGNFGTDSNSDGVGDAVQSTSNLQNCVMSNNTQKLEANIVNGSHYAYCSFNASVAAGDKLYTCFSGKAGKGQVNAFIFNRKSDGSNETQQVLGTVNAQNYEFLSMLMTVTSVYSTPTTYTRYNINNEAQSQTFAGNGENITINQIFVFNLTKLFGAGNEPSKATMDTFMQAYIAANGFFVTAPFGASDPHQKLSIIDKEVAAPYGICRSLNGSTDYLYCNNHSNIDIVTASSQKPLSIFNIVYFDPSLATSAYIMAKNGTSASDMQYGYFYDASNERISVYLEGAQRLLSDIGTVQKGKWYFLGFSWDGTNINFYINNKLNRTIAYSGTLTSRPNFRIGCRGNNGIYLKGKVGAQLITQSPAQDIINWSKKVKLLERYGIAV